MPPKREFATLLVEDKKIRDFIRKHPTQNYKAAGIDRVEIERTRDEVKVTLFVARPGLIIGKKGQEVERLQNEMQNLIGRRINLKVEEVGRPDLQAQLVGRENFRTTAASSQFSPDDEAGGGRNDGCRSQRDQDPVGRATGWSRNGSSRKTH